MEFTYEEKQKVKSMVEAVTGYAMDYRSIYNAYIEADTWFGGYVIHANWTEEIMSKCKECMKADSFFKKVSVKKGCIYFKI